MQKLSFLRSVHSAPRILIRTIRPKIPVAAYSSSRTDVEDASTSTITPEIMRPNQVLDGPDLYDSLCIFKQDDNPRRGGYFKFLHDVVRNVDGWRDLDTVYLTGFNTRAYHIRFQTEKLDAAYAKLSQEFPDLGVFRHRTYKFTSNLIIMPEPPGTDPNLVLSMVQKLYRPISHFPGYESHVCKPPGLRLRFDSTKAASDALVMLDGREARVQHPWTVRYDQTTLSPLAVTYPTTNLWARGTFQGKISLAKETITKHHANMPGFRGIHIKPSPGRIVVATAMFNSVLAATDAVDALLNQRIGPPGNAVIFRTVRYTESMPWFDSSDFSKTCTLIVEGRGTPPRLVELADMFKSLSGFKNVKEVGLNPIGKQRKRILVELNTAEDTVAAHASINKRIRAIFSRFSYDEFKP